MVIKTSQDFEKEFKRIPKNLKEITKKKLALFLESPSHPSLRVKKVQGYSETPPIMELSINMSLRITYQIFSDFIYLRYVGTHEIFKSP